jgi:hypothetical protein
LGAADFHSRWYGAQALLLDGQDPYSPEVTAEIEAIRDPNQRQLNSFSFAFPLHVIFTFLPLAFMSYGLAASFWIVTLQWVVFGITLLLMYMVGWKPSPLGIGAALLGSIFFYPAARTILLGQFTLHVTLFLAMSLFFLRRRQDGWAGFWLAAASIKPQMVLLVGLWMVLWAVFRRRTRFLLGVIVGGGALLLGSMVFLPRWPISFIEDIQRYAEVASGRNPLEVLGEFIVPGNPAIVSVVLGGVLLLLTIVAWYWGVGDSAVLGRFLKNKGDLTNGSEASDARNENEGAGIDRRFEWVLYWTIGVSLLVLFQTGSTNQALLFIPFFFWFWQGLKSWGRMAAVLIAIVVIVTPWILFLTTISGDYENPLLLLPLPFFCLIIHGIKWFRMQGGERLSGKMEGVG